MGGTGMESFDLLGDAPANLVGTAIIVGVIVAALVLIAIIVDVTCFFVNKTGTCSCLRTIDYRYCTRNKLAIA
jgi:hypothetical protein